MGNQIRRTLLRCEAGGGAELAALIGICTTVSNVTISTSDWMANGAEGTLVLVTTDPAFTASLSSGSRKSTQVSHESR